MREKMTPGPWAVTLGDGSRPARYFVDSTIPSQMPVARIYGNEYDARAIACLPELIDAARKASRCLSHIKDGPLADPLKYVPGSAYIEAYDQLRRILARIDGEKA